MYNLSKDYEKLYELICQGQEVACYVNSENKRELAKFYMDKRGAIQAFIGSRFIMGVTEDWKEFFLECCSDLKLEWIDSQPKIQLFDPNINKPKKSEKYEDRSITVTTIDSDGLVQCAYYSFSEKEWCFLTFACADEDEGINYEVNWKWFYSPVTKKDLV